MGEDQEERRKGKEGCVYFIETNDGAFVKIGYSIHVPRRFDQIGVLLPGLRLIGHMPGTMATEQWLHAKFAAHRERSEWFRHTDDVRGFISALGLIPATKSEPVGSTQPFCVHHHYGSDSKNAVAQAMVAMRNKKLSPARRKEIAAKAAQTRWAKKPETDNEAAKG